MESAILDNYSPYVIIGKLSRDFIITSDNLEINDIPGGHLLYSAIGMRPWEHHPGLVSRVGKNYPAEFIDLLKKNGFNSKGIRVLDKDLEPRRFFCHYYEEDFYNLERKSQSVLSYYFHSGKTFPRELLGYVPQPRYVKDIDQRTSETVLARDIPTEFTEARCVHLCPMDYLTHYLLPQAFSGDEKRTITLEASTEYMLPVFWGDVKKLVHGLTAFIVKEKDIRSLFADKLRMTDIKDMMKALLDLGTENVVTAMDNNDYLFGSNRDDIVRCLRTSEVINNKDKIGSLSCFCGAFLTGLNETYDLCSSAARGAARVSLLHNEMNPYHNLDVLGVLANEKANAFMHLIS